MKKIVITGGLGYIGTELCKILSGEARYKKIIVLDKKFLSERVHQLSSWGIEFIHGSILDKDLMKDLLQDADVVYHLAGITDVAYTKTESDSEKDKEIWETSITGTKNVINFTKKSCKIIFPSTHVVYEGFEETKFDIEETEPTKAVLTYSKGKVQSEIDFQSSDKNFIILRLASLYGYSEDSMRINIMPNLFSKITSQNGKIKLFSKGVQYKSLVNVVDVVRAMKFLSESDINREIFHISNEFMTIKEVAEICKKHNPKVELVETQDEIPNLGYTISNKKILSTGFKFIYDIDTSIKDMIDKWSLKSEDKGLEFIIRGAKEYVDERGKISNYELTEPINLIGYIESKKGTVRANHYHPIQEQKCLLVKGQYISVTKDLSEKNSPIETRLINQGDIAVIKPNVAHTMVFLEDSIFLNLVRGEREHENYGITHTIPYTLVDENFKNDLLKNFSKKCRVCENLNLEDVVSLGMSPLANNLIDDENTKHEEFPLEIKYCNVCSNVQLSYIVPPEKMFDNYLYVSSTASTFREHFKKAAEHYIKKFKLNKKSKVLDIGSNDGIFLKPMKDNNISVLGIEPAKNISKIANDSGIETINSYFNLDLAKEIKSKYGSFNLITASNVFAHSDKLSEMAEGVKKLLKDNGCFVVEVQYIMGMLKELTFDNIYHEHVNYWSLNSLNNFFRHHKMSIIDFELIETHGGSIRVYVSKSENIHNKKITDHIELEKMEGVVGLSNYKSFAKKLNEIKQNAQKNIEIINTKYKNVYGYGAPAKATTSLNFYGYNNKNIKCIIEDNPLKMDKIIPGTKIPIKSKEYMNNNLPDCVIVLAWNFYDLIVSSNKELIEKGVKFYNIKDLEKNEMIL
jgi:nucleoside-diphosphate-sugar epimerase/dTDP-4-dehydrorhamnose 3,5-epimerase-like enzyme